MINNFEINSLLKPYISKTDVKCPCDPFKSKYNILFFFKACSVYKDIVYDNTTNDVKII